MFSVMGSSKIIASWELSHNVQKKHCPLLDLQTPLPILHSEFHDPHMQNSKYDNTNCLGGLAIAWIGFCGSCAQALGTLWVPVSHKTQKSHANHVSLMTASSVCTHEALCWPNSSVRLQPAADLWGQAARVSGRAAEEGGRNEADVCSEGEGEGVWAEGGWERGMFLFCPLPLVLSNPGSD